MNGRNSISLFLGNNTFLFYSEESKVDHIYEKIIKDIICLKKY